MLSSDGANQVSTQTNEGQQSLPQAATETPKLPPGGAINRIIDALKGDDSPDGFLPAGENMLLAVSDEFTGALGVEAIRVARDRHATAVDRQDVQDADRRLRNSGTADRRTWFLGLGGVAGGAAAAAIVAVAISPTPIRHVNYWWLVIAILILITATLAGVSYPRGKRKV